MTWLALRLMRPSLVTVALLTAAATTYVLYGAATVQRQLDAQGLPDCVDPNLCWPVGPAANAVLGMQLTAAFAPVLIGLVLGVPLFARELEEGTVAFALTQSVSRSRWVLTKLLWAMAVGATCTAVFATTYRLVAARYTVLANDLYEVLELLHHHHVALMVMLTVFATAVAAVIGLSTGSTLRTVTLSVLCWPFVLIVVHGGAALLSYPLSLLPIDAGSTAAAELTADEAGYWTADISLADAFSYVAAAALVGYTAVAVAVARRLGRRVPR